MTTVSFKIASSLLVVAAATGMAAAEDRKNYPGIGCLASGTSITSINRESGAGHAFSTQSATRTSFICPAVKDYESIRDATVFVIDQNVSQVLECVLHVEDVELGTMGTLRRATTASFASAAPVKLEFGGIPADDFSTYWLKCFVPGVEDGRRSGIVMYQITENEG